ERGQSTLRCSRGLREPAHRIRIRHEARGEIGAADTTGHRHGSCNMSGKERAEECRRGSGLTHRLPRSGWVAKHLRARSEIRGDGCNAVHVLTEVRAIAIKQHILRLR